MITRTQGSLVLSLFLVSAIGLIALGAAHGIMALHTQLIVLRIKHAQQAALVDGLVIYGVGTLLDESTLNVQLEQGDSVRELVIGSWPHDDAETPYSGIIRVRRTDETTIRIAATLMRDSKKVAYACADVEYGDRGPFIRAWHYRDAA